MKKSKMIIAGIFIAALVFMGLFLWFIAYSSTTDLSHDQRFKPYLNKAYIVKQPSALKRSIESSNRFSAYYIDVSSEEDFKNDPSILKKYHIGDTITFSTAKKYFSYHIGDSYYLLGKEKLDSGEIIEFEYGANFDYSPAIWETLDEFLERRKIINDFP